MNTPAQVTEVHRKLAEEVMFLVNYGERLKAARLIADGEARAVSAAVTILTCTHHNDRQRAACPVCLVASQRAERDQLRAEVERLNAAISGMPKLIGEQNGRLARERHDAVARAERAEAELAKERARLEAVWNNCWLVHKGNENMFAVFSHVCGDYITPWLETERAAIDAAMQEDAK